MDFLHKILPVQLTLAILELINGIIDGGPSAQFFDAPLTAVIT